MVKAQSAMAKSFQVGSWQRRVRKYAEAIDLREIWKLGQNK